MPEQRMRWMQQNLVHIDDDYNLFKEKLIARIPKTSTLLGNIPLAHDG